MPDIHLSPFISCLSWTLLLAPLIAASAIWLFGIHRRRLAANLALTGMVTSFGCALWVFDQALRQHSHAFAWESSVEWLSVPGFTVSFGVLLDPLSLLMTLIVTGVGSLIFLYSTAYMKADAAFSRYFGVLSLFAFSMLTIVLSPNWIQLFIGWELVGFCSYLLIGHWYAKPSAAEAGKKAFMVNRVADCGFLLGILALWGISGSAASERTLHFHSLQARLPDLIASGAIPSSLLTLVGLLLFCGPIGKSAQFPLHVWLPDAMEGPTPVSALIHAATMVAAGVYLLCRSFWLFAMSPVTLSTIAWVGGLSAILSALLAVVEQDLKRILAYSTLSQLGYMVMAVGLGSPIAGMYHLSTHAFFKALLFLAAGSVIHGTHQQDIRKLGALRRSMPWTSGSFAIGSLALCGIPGLSGFFSKDAILVLAHERNAILYWLAVSTAGLTAFYIGRAWFVAFTGTSHGTHAHESPPIMTGPLSILAVLSIVGGYLGIPHFLGHPNETIHWQVVFTSISAAGIGLALSWLIYGRHWLSAQKLVLALAVPYSFLQRRYGIDEFYNAYVTHIQQRFIAGFCAWFERACIIRIGVNGIAWTTYYASWLIRLWQTGKVQTYALTFLIGVLGLIFHLIRQ